MVKNYSLVLFINDDRLSPEIDDELVWFTVADLLVRIGSTITWIIMLKIEQIKLETILNVC